MTIPACTKNTASSRQTQTASRGRSRAASAEGAMLHAQRAHTRATPKARAMCRGNSVPAPRASTPPSRSNKVVSQVYQAAAAIDGTEAHPWKKARGKTAIRRAVNACGQRGIPHIYSGRPHARDPMHAVQHVQTSVEKLAYT